MTKELIDECNKIHNIMLIHQQYIEQQLLPEIYQTKGEDMTEEMINIRENLKYWLDIYEKL